MKELRDTSQTFSNYPEALYAVDVTFQKPFCPSGAILEGRIYFSHKQKLYGAEVEVIFLSNLIAIACSNHYPGSVSDVEIIQQRIEAHKKCLRKKERDRNIPDGRLHFNNYPDEWALYADKGYHCLQEIRHAMIPVKRPPRGILSISDEAFNRRVSSDRIIPENYFARLTCLWSLFAQNDGGAWGSTTISLILLWFSLIFTLSLILCGHRMEANLFQ